MTGIPRSVMDTSLRAINPAFGHEWKECRWAPQRICLPSIRVRKRRFQRFCRGSHTHRPNPCSRSPKALAWTVYISQAGVTTKRCSPSVGP